MRDQLLGGRYRLVRQVGEGGMGQVWEAQDETLARPVAVKVISMLAGGGSRGDEARARFLREARITAQLQHSNIVTVHDLGETDRGNDRAPFLVMELVRGEGLDAMLRRDAVTLPDAARWGAQICDALADAHNAGIMHRDIKPSNILITPSGSVKVLDFGVARAADLYATADRLTQTGFIVGTPPYMAPEQARGFPEPRSDLYALGCLLFELITGQLPFQAPDTLGYLSAHLTQEPPTPSSVSTGIPSAWDHLVLTLLHKDPDQRHPGAADLAQALRQLDDAESIPLRNVYSGAPRRMALAMRALLAKRTAETATRQAKLRETTPHRSVQARARKTHLVGYTAVTLPWLPGQTAGRRKATITRWHRQVGDAVAVGEPLLEVSSGRGDIVITSPTGGILYVICRRRGESALTGSMIAAVGTPEAQVSQVSQVSRASLPRRTRITLLSLFLLLASLVMGLVSVASPLFEEDMHKAQAGDCVAQKYFVRKGQGDSKWYMMPCNLMKVRASFDSEGDGTAYFKVLYRNPPLDCDRYVKGWSVPDNSATSWDDMTLCMRRL